MGYTAAQGQSLGIRVMFEGREKYSLLDRYPDGGTSMGTNDATGDFAGWLEGRVASQRYLDVSNGVTGAPPDHHGDRSVALAAPPARRRRRGRQGRAVAVLEVSADAGPGRLRRRAPTRRRRCACSWTTASAVRRLPRRRRQLEVVAAPGSFDSMSAFLTWAREQYASGEGMR